jgi:hypothetical protein
MAAPILVPCLVTLRDEFNRLAPGRDKGADGWIGDAAHQQESSDHNPDETGRTPYEDADSINEVHAIDIDKDLGGGLDLDDFVEIVRLNHYRGYDDRLQNIIWRGRIASRSWSWTWKPYDGASKHYDHAHFSARYSTAQENDTSYWGVSMNPTDIDKIATAVVAKLGGTHDQARTELLTTKLGRSDVTVAMAWQNTEAETRGLAGKVDQLVAGEPA